MGISFFSSSTVSFGYDSKGMISRGESPVKRKSFSPEEMQALDSYTASLLLSSEASLQRIQAFIDIEDVVHPNKPKSPLERGLKKISALKNSIVNSFTPNKSLSPQILQQTDDLTLQRQSQKSLI